MAEELRAVEIPQDDVDYVLVDERTGERKFIGGTHKGDVWQLPPYQRIEPADAEDQVEVSPKPPPDLAGTSGTKADGGKYRPLLVVEGFPRALIAVARVMEFGAQKYTDHGWKTVDNGYERYTNALHRHLWEEFLCEFDEETEEHHAAHAACCALIRLERLLMQSEEDA